MKGTIPSSPTVRSQCSPWGWRFRTWRSSPCWASSSCFLLSRFPAPTILLWLYLRLYCSDVLLLWYAVLTMRRTLQRSLPSISSRVLHALYVLKDHRGGWTCFPSRGRARRRGLFSCIPSVSWCTSSCVRPSGRSSTTLVLVVSFSSFEVERLCGRSRAGCLRNVSVRFLWSLTRLVEVELLCGHEGRLPS